VPEGTDVDEEGDEKAPAQAAAAAEPPRETPPPAPPPAPAIVQPAPPAVEPPRADTAPRKKHRPKPASMDMSAIDSMLADLAAPPVDVARKRRKTGEHAAVAPQPIPAPAVPITEPATPPAQEIQATEPATPAAPVLEALEGPPPVVQREHAESERRRVTGEIQQLIMNELGPDDLVDALAPDERKDHLAALSEPPGSTGADSEPPIRFTPGRLVSFMPPPPSEADSLEEDFESVIGSADANGIGETSSPTAALTEDSGVTELGEDAVIAGVMDDDDVDAQGDFEILDEDDAGVEIVAESGQGDVVDSLMAEMDRDSFEPAGPADLQLLEEEGVSDALDHLFDESSEEDHAASRPSLRAPDTLPDDAVPPGLVRDRPARRPAQPQPPPPVPELADDAASKKKGFFGKLFGK